jgi:hypothetical protein
MDFILFQKSSNNAGYHVKLIFILFTQNYYLIFVEVHILVFYAFADYGR